MEIPLKVLDQGLFCTSGNFFIDAWKPVSICVVTHAHGDHAYLGHELYIGSPETIKIIKHRLGKDTPCQVLEYQQKIKLGNSWVSLHPAGHILGSTQIRIENSKSVTLISGDYKRAYDPTCTPFEIVLCDIFVTESTLDFPFINGLKMKSLKSKSMIGGKKMLSMSILLFCFVTHLEKLNVF